MDDERIEEQAIEPREEQAIEPREEHPPAADEVAAEDGEDGFEAAWDPDADEPEDARRPDEADVEGAYEPDPETADHYDGPEGSTLESEALAPGLVPCPSCGEPVERRQLVCLNCGGRVALGGGGLAVPELLVTLLVAVVVVGAALFGFAIAEITSGDDDGGGSGAATQASADRSTTARTAPEPPAVVEGGGQPQRTETARQRRDPLAWPAGLSAHTVVLVTTGDRPAALAVAREARSTGLEAGLLPSDPYNLGTGLWIVFSGRFTTREGAARQAAQLADRYPGAYPQLIQRSQ